MKFRCKNCGNEKELVKTTTIIQNGEIVVKEAECEKCGTYMEYVKEHIGFCTNVLRFDILSPNEKKKVLKKRSREDYKKNIQEQKREIDLKTIKK